MQLFPTNRPVALVKRDDTEVKNVYAAKPTKEAAADKVAPVTFDFKPLKHRPHAPPQTAAEPPEQGFQERSNDDRRKYCRRVQSTPVLYDLRADGDRRRRNQRKGDITTAIDEIA